MSEERTPKPQCGRPAAFRFQWVNGKTGLICHEHYDKLVIVASTLGCAAHIEPVESGTCEQKVSRHAPA